MSADSPSRRSGSSRTSGRSQARGSAKIGEDGTTALTVLRNQILARLPAAELDRLQQHSETISAELREIFFEEGDAVESVYFPLTGLGSLVTVLKDGTSLEAMTVGREGFMGLPLFHGVTTGRSRGMCQVAGEFVRIPAPQFPEIARSSPALTSALHRYSQFSQEVVAQSAACNSVHLLEQRCARWLLTTCEGVGRDHFNLTQEFLSQMLAVRRTGVTVAMGALERQGLISHRYGTVTILDAKGLAKASCECHATVMEKARELLSDPR